MNNINDILLSNPQTGTLRTDITVDELPDDLPLLKTALVYAIKQLVERDRLLTETRRRVDILESLVETRVLGELRDLLHTLHTR